MAAIKYLSCVGPEELRTPNVAQVGVGNGVQGMLGTSHKWLLLGIWRKLTYFFNCDMLIGGLNEQYSCNLFLTWEWQEEMP